jgi:uncharacterized membrane protein
MPGAYCLENFNFEILHRATMPLSALTLYDVLLGVHVVCGAASLLLGGYVMVARKGDRRHRAVGTAYYYALLVASLVAIGITLLHPNTFLLIIGIFNCYMLLSGRRYLRIRTTDDVRPADRLLSIAMLLAALGFIGLGANNLWRGNTFGVVMLVFGAIGFLFVYQDHRNFSGTVPTANFGLTTHIQRMTGSYIASFTAFLVVNNTLLPGIIAWLLPTVLLVPLLIRWSRQYKAS